jgi:hypothetical protein
MTRPLPDAVRVIERGWSARTSKHWLLDELLRADAVRLENGEIVPTMAA